jgi:small subunit ribosomal protein S16
LAQKEQQPPIFRENEVKMATVIRLARFGKRHNPIYRAVVIDSRKARDDSFIEQVGFYNPNLKKAEIKFDQEKVLKWLQSGAQPSDTVRSLLKKVGIMELFHEIRAGRSIEGKTASPKAEKEKKAKLGPKALAKLEAEKAAKEAPAEEAPAEAAAEA